MINQLVKIIDTYIETRDMSYADYRYVERHVYIILSKRSLFWQLESWELTNQFLLDILDSWYDVSKHEGSKKNYINFLLLFSSQKLLAVTNNILTIPPYVLKEYMRYKNWTVQLWKKELAMVESAVANNSLWAVEGWWKMNADQTNIIDDELRNKILLWLMGSHLSSRERTAIDKFYRQWYSKKEIWEQLWVSWERARQIIQIWLEKCKWAVWWSYNPVE